jgi:hypothetical protein
MNHRETAVVETVGCSTIRDAHERGSANITTAYLAWDSRISVSECAVASKQNKSYAFGTMEDMPSVMKLVASVWRQCIPTPSSQGPKPDVSAKWVAPQEAEAVCVSRTHADYASAACELPPGAPLVQTSNNTFRTTSVYAAFLQPPC